MPVPEPVQTVARVLHVRLANRPLGTLDATRTLRVLQLKQADVALRVDGGPAASQVAPLGRVDQRVGGQKAAAHRGHCQPGCGGGHLERVNSLRVVGDEAAEPENALTQNGHIVGTCV